MRMRVKQNLHNLGTTRPTCRWVRTGPFGVEFVRTHSVVHGYGSVDTLLNVDSSVLTLYSPSWLFLEPCRFTGVFTFPKNNNRACPLASGHLKPDYCPPFPLPSWMSPRCSDGTYAFYIIVSVFDIDGVCYASREHIICSVTLFVG